MGLSTSHGRGGVLERVPTDEGDDCGSQERRASVATRFCPQKTEP